MSATLARRAPYPVRANNKRCSKCGKSVARSAFACRRCGKRQRLRPRTILLMSSLALLGAMFAFASGSIFVGGSHAVEPLATATPAQRLGVEGRQTAPSSAHPPALTARELWDAYARDPVAADRRFKDHPLEVTGTIRVVDRDFEGSVLVRLAAGGTFDTVNARLATREDPTWSGVAKGKDIALVCVGRGSVIGAPLLGGCVPR